MRVTFVAAARVAILGVLLAVVSLPLAGAESRGYKVIAHPSNPATSLPREQVARYFLKKLTSWPSGAAVMPVDLAKDSPARASFSEGVLEKSVAEVTAYWQQQIFSGRGVPPPEKRTDAEVVAFVESTPGAIGYVSEAAAVGGAKVIRIVDAE
jgi:ABC-type phosphate transport system substrate-binding protein